MVYSYSHEEKTPVVFSYGYKTPARYYDGRAFFDFGGPILVDLLLDEECRRLCLNEGGAEQEKNTKGGKEGVCARGCIGLRAQNLRRCSGAGRHI